MKAEGAPLGKGYGLPVYQLPVFREMSFGRAGCPLSCGHYQGKMDYAEVVCPVAEEISRDRHVTVANELLLHESNMRLIARAVGKIYEHRAEIA